VNDTTRELGGTLGVAIVGSAMSSVYASHLGSALARLGAPAAAAADARQSVVAGLGVAAHLPPDLRAAAAAATRLAFIDGLHAGSFVAAGATAAAALATLVFLPARARHAAATATEAGADTTAGAPSQPAVLAQPARGTADLAGRRS
jgi:DHA2 family multidrug resistance protein-like MFS transporter